MSTSSKLQKKAKRTSLVTIGQQANDEFIQETMASKQLRQFEANYVSMMEQIQRIAQPVSFKGLKEFYNIT